MLRIKIFIWIIPFVFILMAACDSGQNRHIDYNQVYEAVESQIKLQDVVNETFKLVVETRNARHWDAGDQLSVGQVVVTRHDSVSFTFQFNHLNENDNHLYRGEIEASIDTSFFREGSLSEWRFTTLSVDYDEITGVVVVENLSSQDDSMVFQLTSNNLQLRDTLNHVHQAVWEQQVVLHDFQTETNTIQDFYISSTGYASGHTRLYSGYHAEITEPLVEQDSCCWIRTGRIGFEVSDVDVANIFVDFSDTTAGICNARYLLSVDNSKYEQFKIY